MRPIRVSANSTDQGQGTSASPVIRMDTNLNPFQVGFGCVISGTPTYTVQHTFSDVFDTATSAYTWFNHPAVTATTGNADGNYAFPVRGIRVLMTGGAAGSVDLFVVQAGTRS